MVAGIDTCAIPELGASKTTVQAAVRPRFRGVPGPSSTILGTMSVCKSCGDEVDELVSVRVGGKTRKLCESCADRVREEAEVAEQSEAVVQKMMDFKGRR